jgi:hypothetical protein
MLYDRLVDQLVTPVSLLPISSSDRTLRDTPIEIEALWDTGAMVTCIKPKLCGLLKLRLAETGSSAAIAGVGGEITAGFTLVNIFLTHNLEIEYCPVYVLDFPGDADMIIGMDIITKGDFTVCNADGKTSFSFVIPSFPDRIDLAEKADMANKRNTI